MKIAVITCYFDPDYVRARTLRSAVKAYPDSRTIVVKNKHKSWLRYPEIIWKLIQLRRFQKPDLYMLTFRGQEILPFVLLLAGLKPVVFDELVVPRAYATEGHKPSLSRSFKYFLAKLADPLYRVWLRHCRVILADTAAHADLSARSSHINIRQYRILPVGADEAVFMPNTEHKSVLTTKPFVVFFYGLFMTPLHGLDTILAAAALVQSNSDISFCIVGGNRQTAKQIAASVAAGAHITYERRLPFEALPAAIHEAAVCLGGPFGGTDQAQHVITGKEYQFLACSAPTIVGVSEATDEFFKDKENALIVPQVDPEALAKAIRWAATHRDELVDIGRRGRQLYERAFSSEVIARDTKTILDELASQL